jgi:hypothetical protein
MTQLCWPKQAHSEIVESLDSLEFWDGWTVGVFPQGHACTILCFQPRKFRLVGKLSGSAHVRSFGLQT